MSKMKKVIFTLSNKAKSLLFMTIFCFAIVSMVAPKDMSKRVSLSTEEALVDFALDHNQCLGEGHGSETFGYNQCMEQLQIQRRSIVKI
jgi:hypothetical protein